MKNNKIGYYNTVQLTTFITNALILIATHNL